MVPAWTWLCLLSGSEGSWHEVLLQGRNTSADLSVSSPPVMRIAAAMEIFIFLEFIHTKRLTKKNKLETIERKNQKTIKKKRLRVMDLVRT